MKHGLDSSKVEISTRMTPHVLASEKRLMMLNCKLYWMRTTRKRNDSLQMRLGVQQQAITKRLRAMGKILKYGKWVPHEMTERQMENRKVTCEMLLQRYRRKSFLHRTVTGDEK